MADYNRNERGSSRHSNEDWNDYKNRSGRFENERNSGYGNSSYQGYDEDDSSWQGQGRFGRESRMNEQGSGGYGRSFDSDINSGGYGNSYGSGGFGSSGSGSQGFGSRRGLYDRDYRGMNRSTSQMGTRMGAGNYGNYGDRGRFDEGRDFQGGNYGRNYGGGYGRQDYDRHEGHEDRSWWDRATDKVSSWFGDDDSDRDNRDRRSQGMYRGRGPKNYTRSDERIKEDINDRLSDDPYIDASEIDVTVSSGEVILTGNVDHRSTKRRAEDIAEAVSGVKHLENRIRISETSSSIFGNSGSEDSETTSRTSSSSTSAVPGSDRTRNKGHYAS